MKEKKTTPVIFLAFAQGATEAHLNQLKRESTLLRDLFFPLDQTGHLKLLREESTNQEDIVKLLNQYKDEVALFHYAGHADEDHLFFENGKGYGVGLATLLGLQKSLKFVFLNGCFTQQQALKFLAAGVPAVLATTRKVADADATYFSETFYHALTNQYILADAFKMASAALKMKSDRYDYGEEEVVFCRGLDIEETRWQEDIPFRLFVKEEEKALLDWRLTSPDVDSDTIKKQDQHILDGYLQWIKTEYNQISLPSIKEGRDLPKIPLEEVYVALKVSGKSANRELELSHRQIVRTYNKILEELDFEPSREEKQEIYEQILQQNPQLKAWDQGRQKALTVAAQSWQKDEENTVSVSLAEAFRNERDLVILGDPGSGKSTLVRWLAVRLAGAMQKQIQTGEAQSTWVPGHQVDVHYKNEAELLNLGPARLPILLRISDYARYYEEQKRNSPTEARGIIDYLGLHLPSVPTLKIKDLNKLFRFYLSQNHTVVMLDGLDEVTNARAEVLREVTSFIDHWVHGASASMSYIRLDLNEDKPYKTGGNQLIVTSRIVGYQAAPLSGNLTHVTIQPMEEAAVRHFCSVWVTQLYGNQAQKNQEDTVKQEIKNLQDAIFDNQRPRIRELAANPLLVTILALIFRNQNGKLPESRAELYQRALQILLDKWKVDIAIEPHELTTMMAPLAAHMHESPSDDIRESDLIFFLEKELTRVRGGDPAQEITLVIQREVRRFVHRLKEDVGLLAERGEKLYHFLHRTFQEYLSGLYLISNKANASKAIIERIDDPIWREPILLALGAADLEWPSIQLEELIKALLFADDPLLDLLPRSSLFIVHAIPEMENLSEGLMNDILEQLLKAYSDLNGVAKYQNIREQLSLGFAKLRQGKRSDVLDRYFFRVLEAPTSTDEWVGLLALIRDQKWWQPAWTAVVVRNVDDDQGAWGWPANQLLLAYFSEQDPGGGLQNLLMRNKLLQHPSWHEFVRQDPAWIRLLTALYGGWRSQQETVSSYHQNLNERWRVVLELTPVPDLVAEGTRLDQARNDLIATITGQNSTFDARYIYRDGPFSRALLRAISQNDPAQSMDPYFLDQWSTSTSPSVQALALLGLTCTGYNVAALIYQNQLAHANTEAIDRYLAHLERLKDVLLFSVTAAYLQVSKAFKDLEKTNWMKIPTERRPDVFHRMLQTFSERGLPPLSFSFLDQHKRPWPDEKEDVESGYAAKLEAEFLSAFLGLWSSDDPFYNLCVVLDTMGGVFQKNYELILHALNKIPQSAQLQNVYRYPWGQPEFYFIPGYNNKDEQLLLALQVIDVLPPKYDMLREWFVVVLWPLIEASSELKAFAYSILYTSTYQDRIRELTPVVFDAKKGIPYMLTLIEGIKNPYYRLKAAGKMFRQTYGIPFLRICVKAMNELKAPEALFLGTLDFIDLMAKSAEDVSGAADEKTAMRVLIGEGSFGKIIQRAENAIPEIRNSYNRLRAWCYLSDMQTEEAHATACVFKAMDLFPNLTSDKQRVEALKFILHRYGSIAGSYSNWVAINASFKDQWQLNEGLGKSYLNWYSLDQVAADRSDQEHYQAIPALWALLGLSHGVEELSFRFAERDEIAGLWKQVLDGNNSGTAVYQLQQKGKDGLKLDVLAFRTITRLAEEQAEEELNCLLPLLEKPESTVLPLIAPWIKHERHDFRQLAALLQAEASRVSVDNIDLVVDCLKSHSDRLRFRAMIAVHGPKPYSDQINRTLSTSSMTKELFDRLAQLESVNTGIVDPMVGQVLVWMNHNLVHDSVELLDEAIELLKSAREEDRRVGKNIVLRMEKPTNAVWQRLVYHLFLASVAQEDLLKSLLSVVAKQCYRDSPLRDTLFHSPKKVKSFLDEKFLPLLENTLSLPVKVSMIQVALEYALNTPVSISGDTINIARQKLLDQLKINFLQAYNEGDQAFYQAMKQAGSGGYVAHDGICRDGKILAEKIIEIPGQTELLIKWTLQEIDDELIDYDSSERIGGYLAIIAANIAILRPETVLSLVERSYFRDLLIETIESHPFWLARQGAISMLASMGELDERALKSLAKALQDVSYPSEQARNCFIYFRSLINQRVLDQLFLNLERGPGLVMQTSVQILSEVARHEKTEVAVRQQIIKRMADYLRMTINAPLKRRAIYRWEDGADSPVFLTTLDHVLYGELIKIVGLL